MSDMGLLHVRSVLVGDPLHKGISGGERKRLCVALELITEPRLLFLDEPTSGLDSVTAFGLISTLKQLSRGHPPTDGSPTSQGVQQQPVASRSHCATDSAGQAAGFHDQGRAPCTVICTIHQPQSKIFHTFDQLFLLQRGSVVYQGPAVGALDHFAALGYPCPGALDTGLPRRAG